MQDLNYKTNDKSIRFALIDKLNIDFQDHPGTAIISEFSLPNSTARVDVAVINGIIHGYELKSDVDNLLRLNRQRDAYNLVFDKITIVVGKTHLVDVLELIPEWWGITIAKNIDDQLNPLLISIRDAETNPYQEIRFVVDLLWKNEALSLLEFVSGSSSNVNLSKKTICDKLVELCKEDRLKELIKRTLVRRFANSNLRVASKSEPCDGEFQPVTMSKMTPSLFQNLYLD